MTMPADSPTATDRASDPEAALTYKAALAELKGILDKLDRGTEVDVDELPAMAARAASLLQVCQQRLQRAEEEVRKVLKPAEDKPAE